MFEDRVAEDRFVGLWGFSFDLLMEKYPNLPEEQQRVKIIQDLEERLSRLSKVTDLNQLDPHAVQAAALRLAHHYRRRGQDEDVRRVLLLYADAFARKGETGFALTAAGWLGQVYDTFLQFNMKDLADALEPKLREFASKGRNEMPTISHSIPVDPTELEKFLQSMTEGDLETCFVRLAIHFLPRRDEEAKQLLEISKSSFVAQVFSRTILDHEGRVVAEVGPLQDDLEGSLAQHISQTMQFKAMFLRLVMERLIEDRKLAAEDFTRFFYCSPLFDANKRPIVEAAIRAYLNGDWLMAIHVLVPQIENTVRRLVQGCGGPIYKKGRNEAMMLRNLDELLRDERAVNVLTPDGTQYLQILLTDQRGWNIRNNVCHGISRAVDFGPIVADRLMHVVLFLALFREKSAEEQATEKE